jgi:hypothetical protein
MCAIQAARCDLHARRAGHNPCPAVDADRAGFRDDRLVAELTHREGGKELRFCFVLATAMRVGHMLGQSHPERHHVTPDHRLESPIVALHDAPFVV